jgi:hypothetical protein
MSPFALKPFAWLKNLLPPVNTYVDTITQRLIDHPQSWRALQASPDVTHLHWMGGGAGIHYGMPEIRVEIDYQSDKLRLFIANGEFALNWREKARLLTGIESWQDSVWGQGFYGEIATNMRES